MNLLLDDITEPGLHNVGRDPHDCTLEELKASGFKPHPSTTAIRRMCMQCMGNSASLVKTCGTGNCPLWPWRMGTRPEAWKGLQTLNPEAKLSISSRIESAIAQEHDSVIGEIEVEADAGSDNSATLRKNR